MFSGIVSRTLLSKLPEKQKCDQFCKKKGKILINYLLENMN